MPGLAETSAEKGDTKRSGGREGRRWWKPHPSLGKDSTHAFDAAQRLLQGAKWTDSEARTAVAQHSFNFVQFDAHSIHLHLRQVRPSPWSGTQSGVLSTAHVGHTSSTIDDVELDICASQTCLSVRPRIFSSPSGV
eukprot:6209910-Pleurochrysis_carterae.AAC.1